MSGSSALSGSLGKAVVGGTLVTRLTSWRLSETIGETAWGDSESAGKTNRLGARKDLTGTIGGKFDTNKKPYAIFRVGDQPKLVLWEDATSPHYWHFASCLIQSFELEVNPDTKEVVAWTANFGSDGNYYAPGEAGAPVETLPTS